MFAALHQVVRTKLVELFAEPDFELARVVPHLAARKTHQEVFATLDVNGDRKVTPAEVIAYKGPGAQALEPILAAVGTEMNFNAGNQSVNDLPGVTFAQMLTLNRRGPAGGVNARVSGWIAPGRLEGTHDAAVFCDGSVRNAGALRRAPAFFSLLPYIEQENLYSSQFRLNDDRGGTVEGILIGLLLPAVAPSPTATKAMTFQGVIIAPAATGNLSNSAGFGSVELELPNGPGGAAVGRLKITAP
jgi:hypothetical protein